MVVDSLLFPILKLTDADVYLKILHYSIPRNLLGSCNLSPVPRSSHGGVGEITVTFQQLFGMKN